jgi:hypothetical protein
VPREGLERMPGVVTYGELKELSLLSDRDGIFDLPIYCESAVSSCH